MTTKAKTESKINWIAIISVLVLVYITYNRCSNDSPKEDNTQLVFALQDSLQTWVTQDSLNKAKISLLETADSNKFLQIKSRDSTIIHLQSVIAKRREKGGMESPGSSVTTGTTETKGTGTSKKTMVLENENQSPSYFNEFNFDGWVIGTSLATKDSTTYTFNIRNEFDIVVDEDKTGFLGLGRSVPFVEMTNYNPYTTTKTLRTYRVTTPKPYNLVVGPTLTYGWGGWTLGMGAMYPLAKFRL